MGKFLKKKKSYLAQKIFQTKHSLSVQLGPVKVGAQRHIFPLKHVPPLLHGGLQVSKGKKIII